MRTRLLQVDRDRPDPEALAEAASILKRGGLTAFATETVYGLGAIATDPQAVARIFQAKGRPSFNPLIVHVADSDQARLVSKAWPRTADLLSAAFWPGPLTLVVPASGLVPQLVTGGRDTVAVRAPATGVAQGLIRATGSPLAAPSANLSNRLSPTTAEHVLADLDGAIDLILDSGPTSLGIESTVVDVTGSHVRILRPGPVGLDRLSVCLEGINHVVEARGNPVSAAATSPGMQPIHYAPRTTTWRANGWDEIAGFRWPSAAGLLVLGTTSIPPLPSGVEVVRFEDPESAAENLYRVLHELDARRKDAIVVFMPPDSPRWAAVRDRLIRACRPLPDPA